MPEQPQLTPEQRKELEDKLKSMSPQELLEFQKKQCIFCQITSGAIPSKKVFEDASCLAILDINPATKGHILLLPKEHYAIMPQIPPQDLDHLFALTKNISQLLLRALRVSGTSIFIANGVAAGQRAQHFMIHIIPRKEGDNLIPFPEKLIDQKMQENIKAAIEPRLLELLKNPSPASSKAQSLRETKPKVIKKAPKTVKTEPSSAKPQKPSPNDAVTLDNIANLFK